MPREVLVAKVMGGSRDGRSRVDPGSAVSVDPDPAISDLWILDLCKFVLPS